MACLYCNLIAVQLAFARFWTQAFSHGTLSHEEIQRGHANADICLVILHSMACPDPLMPSTHSSYTAWLILISHP